MEGLLREAAAGKASVILSAVNLGEVAYITQRKAGAGGRRKLLAALDALPVTVIDADRGLALAAAEIKAKHTAGKPTESKLKKVIQQSGLYKQKDSRFNYSGAPARRTILIKGQDEAGRRPEFDTTEAFRVKFLKSDPLLSRVSGFGAEEKTKNTAARWEGPGSWTTSGKSWGSKGSLKAC